MKVDIGPYPEGGEERKIDVHIDNYDVWSLDHTLALIIAPTLEMLKKHQHGGPFVDIEDRPDHLKPTEEASDKNGWVDNTHFESWDWVLDEMIWTFKMLSKDDWTDDFYEYENVTPKKDSKIFSERMGIKLKWRDTDGKVAAQERIKNGLRLFGRYYQGLWD